jgi:peptide-methionine (S)-S-oxide reductase
MEKATFGAGCFWGVEAAFRQVSGVVETAVGYTGGTKANPTYEQVCTGSTGHAEAVEVTYDPERVSYVDLLNVFWSNHNPTTKNRQGWDVGSQYRSAVFFHSPEQQAAAEASKEETQAGLHWPKKVVTEIEPASTFWRAEEYHQRYFEKTGRSSCTVELAETIQAEPTAAPHA